ncbi:MAG: CinA family protein [Alphaproteobacteria bacterium]|nr:CinA family protein [Alphaproteobacteria bacterium]
MIDQSLIVLAEEVLRACRGAGLTLATAESCTGGLISGCLTEVAGSSDVVERGFVTYSNLAKTEMLGVPAALIALHGAVSEPVARAMVEGALVHSNADIAVAVTGVAGPGASESKPAGRVHLAVVRRGGQVGHLQRDYGSIGRNRVRQATIRDALEMLLELAGPGMVA